MSKLTKLIATLVVISLTFIGSLEVVTKGCTQLEQYSHDNNAIHAICSNENIKQLYTKYSVNTINKEVNALAFDVKSYPYMSALKLAKFKTERYIVNFDYKLEANKLKEQVASYDLKNKFESIKHYIVNFDAKAKYNLAKTHVIVNYEQLKNYIFLRYTILTLNKEEWKTKYEQKIESTKEVIFTDLGNIKTLLSDATQTATTTSMVETVPAVSSTQSAVETYANYGVINFEESFKAMNNMSNKIVNEMNEQMKKLEKTKAAEMKPAYVEKIKGINQLANDRMAEMSTMIREINNCELIEGTYYYNNTNSECEYAPITRDNFREYFDGTRKMLETRSRNLVEVDFKNDLIELEKKMDDLKMLQIDTFEDWGDSTIEKLKEILTYENIAQGSHEQSVLGKWEELTTLKNEIISKRDSLVEMSLEFEVMTAFVSELKKNIGLLAHEGGDRLYIIRSQANLEFQAREKPIYEAMKAEEAVEAVETLKVVEVPVHTETVHTE